MSPVLSSTEATIADKNDKTQTPKSKCPKPQATPVDDPLTKTGARSDARMEPNAPPPNSAPPYLPTASTSYHGQQGYDYMHQEAPSYPVDQSYYVINGYSTHYVHEMPSDERGYVVDQNQANPVNYYPPGQGGMEMPHNGYPQPIPSNYMGPGYPQGPGPSAVYISNVPPGYPVDPNARPYPGYPPQNSRVDPRNIKKLPPAPPRRSVSTASQPHSDSVDPMLLEAEVARNVTQILNASRSAEQGVPPPGMIKTEMNAMPGSPDKAGKAGSKKRASTSSLPSMPAVDLQKAGMEPKKQFQCQDCQKCVSSARNLKRHENSCKAKKQNSGPEDNKPASSGSPAKAASPAKPITPAQAPLNPYNYPPTAGAQPAPLQYPGNQPPQMRYPGYAPHTALPQVNQSPMFEYPSSGVSGGLHSAPPVMGNYSQPLPPYSTPSSQPMPVSYPPQRPQQPPSSDYNDSSSSFGFNNGMDSFLESAIEEVGHNPLAFIGEEEHSMSSDYQLPSNSSQIKEESKEGKLIELGAVPHPSNRMPETSKSGKKSEKNTKPTDFQCQDCKKYMCSQRSLRRHRTTCKMVVQNNPNGSDPSLPPSAGPKDGDKNFSYPLQCRCEQSFPDEHLLKQHMANCTFVKAEPSTRKESIDGSYNSEKTLMPPPEADESSKVKKEPTEGEEDSMQSSSDVTVGEHLRQMHGNGGAPPLQKKVVKKPLILNRKVKMEGEETEYSNESEDLNDEASRKSEQVADVVNSVVEKIRRQNENFEVPSNKRPSTSAAGGPMAKMPRPDEQQHHQQMHPHQQRIMNKPPPMMLHQGYHPHYQQIPVRPGMPGPHGPVPVHMAPEMQGPPHQILSQPPGPSNVNQPKEQPRYLCPECCKTYSCKKNMRKHRIGTHNLTEDYVEKENPPKRVKVNLDGFITSPGFEKENEIIRQNKPNGTKQKPQPKKPSIAEPGPPPRPVQPGVIPGPSQPQIYYSTQPYAPMGSIEVAQLSESSTPKYEELQPVPMDFSESTSSILDNSPSLYTHDDLDVWDQIKSKIDGPFQHSRENSLDVARIADDLKRSAQAYGEISTSYPNTYVTDQIVVESKKPVELAEADSTFCEDLEDVERITSTVGSKAPYNPNMYHNGHMYGERSGPQVGVMSQPPHQNGDWEKKPAKAAAQDKPKKLCGNCGKSLSSDYSLKRHSAKCKGNQAPSAEPSVQHDGASNDSVPPETSNDDSHIADPDSTTINSVVSDSNPETTRLSAPEPPTSLEPPPANVN